MKKLGQLCGALLVMASSGWAGLATAQEAAPPANPAQTGLVFVPPAIGAPADRVGAGTRDRTRDADGLIELQVPEGGGLTSLADPALIFRLPDGFDGVVQTRYGPVTGGGVLHRDDGTLAEGYHGFDGAGLSLNPGDIYRWRVTLAERNTGRIVAEVWALIERVAERSPDAPPAAQGLWFDALGQHFEIAPGGAVVEKDPADYARLATSAGVAQ